MLCYMRIFRNYNSNITIFSVRLQIYCGFFNMKKVLKAIIKEIKANTLDLSEIKNIAMAIIKTK